MHTCRLLESLQVYGPFSNEPHKSTPLQRHIASRANLVLGTCYKYRTRTPGDHQRDPPKLYGASSTQSQASSGCLQDQVGLAWRGWRRLLHWRRWLELRVVEAGVVPLVVPDARECGRACSPGDILAHDLGAVATFSATLLVLAGRWNASNVLNACNICNMWPNHSGRIRAAR